MTFIGIERGPGPIGSDRVRLELKSAQLSPRILEAGTAHARIALVSTTALLLAGDQVDLRIEVGRDCHLEIVDTAGTVAYDAQGGASGWTLDITVAEGGTLLWNAEPFVVARGANVTRHTTIDLADTAAVCLLETLVVGRTGERGGALYNGTTVTHAGRPLLVEDLDLTNPEVRELPGVLGTATVIDTLALYGRRVNLPVPGARLFQLAGPGTVARFLGRELHRSAVSDRYPGFREVLRHAGHRPDGRPPDVCECIIPAAAL